MFVFPLLLYHHLGYQVSRDTNNRMKLKIKKWQRKSICLLPREDVTNFMFLTFGENAGFQLFCQFLAC